MKLFTIIYYTKRQFQIIQDTFPRLNSLFSIIQMRLSLDANYLLSLAKFQTEIKLLFKINFNNIISRLWQKATIGLSLKITGTYILKFKQLISAVIDGGMLSITASLLASIKDMISATIKTNLVVTAVLQAFLKQSATVSSKLVIQTALRGIIQGATGAQPILLPMVLTFIFEPLAAKLRRLYDYGIEDTETKQRNYDTCVWYMDEQTLSYLDATENIFIYWGCNPFNLIGLYSLGQDTTDSLVRTGGRWYIQRNTRVWMAYTGTTYGTFNQLTNTNISEPVPLLNMYEIELTGTGAGQTKTSVVCNMLTELQKKPTSSNSEGIFNNAGKLYIYLKQSRFTDTPSTNDVLSYLIANNFKIIVSLDSQTQNVIDNEALIQALNSGSTANVQGATYYYKGTVQNPTPENPIKFYGLGEGAFFAIK